MTLSELAFLQRSFPIASWDWPWNAGKWKELYEALMVVLIWAGIIGGVLIAIAVVIIWYLYSHRTVTQQIVKQEIVVRSPAHSITRDFYCVDGSNIIRSWSGRNQPPSLLVLLTLLVALRRRGWAFKCFLDSNVAVVFSEAELKSEKREFIRLCTEFPDHFIEVPSRNRADDYILDYAHARGTPVITNDRFRDYEQTYPWISSDPERRISGVCHSGILQVFPLGLKEPLLSDLSCAIACLRSLLLGPPPNASRG